MAISAEKFRQTTCGVLLFGAEERVLLGRATGTKRLDIPKGIAEPGEAWDQAAVRELEEETGLVVAPADLLPLGLFAYRPGKDLALFASVAAAIDPGTLRCRSLFTTKDGRRMPELAQFAWLEWQDAIGRVGKDMARVLSSLHPAAILARGRRAP